jgi:hypothetical protein
MRDDWKNALLADTAVLFAAASTRRLVSVVSVLSSLYPVVVASRGPSWRSGSPAPSRRASCSRWAGVALISLG